MKVRYEEYYFSDTLRWIILLSFTGWAVYLTFWTQSQWFLMILFPLGVYFFSTKYVTEIDTDKRIISDLFYIFFILSGKHIKFNSLHSIRIDKERINYTANSRARTGVIDYFQYTGTLLYDNRKSLELACKSEYKWFGQEMKRLSEELQIPIERSY